MAYNQFCPIALALDLIGERWAILIVRELLNGGSRFNELQRGLGDISPTVLTKRLGQLTDAGLVMKKKIPGQRGYEYFPTQSAQELLPILEGLGRWGMRWLQRSVAMQDYDVELLMLYFERSVQPHNMIGSENVVRFQFTDLAENGNWWLVVQNGQVDVCNKDPGRDVDVYFTTTLPTMCQLWMGQKSYREALRNDELRLIGPHAMTTNVEHWLAPNVFAGIPAADQIVSP